MKIALPSGALDLTDMETCYKLFRREIIQEIDLKEDRFGFEPEVTAKIAQIRRSGSMNAQFVSRPQSRHAKLTFP